VTTRSYATLTAALAVLILTIWNVESYFASRNAFYADFNAATSAMDISSVAAMTCEGSAAQYLANGLQQLLYAHLNIEGAILAALAIALLWILRMR
jgi:hypothetical protein